MLDCQNVRTEGQSCDSIHRGLCYCSSNDRMIPMLNNRSACLNSLLASRMNSSSKATDPSSPHIELSVTQSASVDDRSHLSATCLEALHPL